MEETSRSELEDHAFICVEIIWRRPAGVSMRTMPLFVWRSYGGDQQD